MQGGRQSERDKEEGVSAVKLDRLSIGKTLKTLRWERTPMNEEKAGGFREEKKNGKGLDR